MVVYKSKILLEKLSQELKEPPLLVSVLDIFTNANLLDEFNTVNSYSMLHGDISG